MDNLLMIVSAACLIYSLYGTIKLMCKIIRSSNMLSKAKKNDAAIIKCISPIFKIKNYLFTIGTELILIYCFYRIVTVLPSRMIFSYISFMVLLIVYCITLIIHVIAVFKEKYAYLTAEGLIFFIGDFSFEKCRFVWVTPQNPDELSDTLLVFPPKEKVPYSVVFTEDLETAHLLTEINGINS